VPTVERIVRAEGASDEVWSRLADYESAPAWDPRLESVVRLRGDGGLGTAYRVRVRYDRVVEQGILAVCRFREREVVQLQGDVGGLRVIETLIMVGGRHEVYVHGLSDLRVRDGAVPAHLGPAALEEVGDAVVPRLAAHLSGVRAAGGGAAHGGAVGD
jgi:hypothetical protein